MNFKKLKDIMIRRWYSPKVSIYPMNSVVVNEVIEFILSNKEVAKITFEDEYDLIIDVNGNQITFWNENKWYSWLNTGEFIDNKGEKITWKYEMPSKINFAKFKLWVRDNKGYNKLKEEQIIKNNTLNKFRKMISEEVK